MRALLLAFCIASAAAFPVLGAVTVDSSTADANVGVGTTTASAASPGYNFTNTAGTVLYVCATASSSGGTATDITGAAYNGTAMTLVTSSKIRFDTSNASVVTLWRLLSPATGTNAVTLTVTSAGTLVGWVSGAISFTGNDTTTPEGTAATATGNSTTPSVGVTSTTAGNIVIDCAATGTCFGNAGCLSGSYNTQTRIWTKDHSGGSGGDNAASQRAAGNGGTVTMAWTVLSDLWGISAVEVKAAGAGGGATNTVAPIMRLMGVGK
jgi:hypothetical protein